MKILTPLFIALAFLATVTADAQTPSGWYAGAGVGLTRGESSEACTAVVPSPDFTVNNIDIFINSAFEQDCKAQDGDEIGFRLFGGYRAIGDGPVRLDLEVGYANLGEIVLGQEVDLLDTSAILNIPLGPVNGLVRGGLAYWDAVDDGVDPLLGVGVEKAFTSTFARLEWVRYFDIESEDVDTFMVSVGKLF